MSKISEINQRMAAKLGVDITTGKPVEGVKKTKEEALRLYEKRQEAKEIFKCCFDACDLDGTFSGIDSCGILVLMLGIEVKETLPNFQPYKMARMLGIEMNVKVAKVDREKDCVYVVLEPAKAGESTKSILASEIAKEVNAGKRPVVWGRITNIIPQRATVNILGYNILGLIDVRYWQGCYTRSLESVCVNGDYYQFEVVKAAPRKEGKDTAWILDRTEVGGNPWLDFPVEALSPGATILVRCVDKPVGKTYWWGVSDRVPGIEIMGDYTNNLPSSYGIMVGLTYRCKVKSLVVSGERKDNRFQVVPFAVSEGDAPALQRARNLMVPYSQENIESSMLEEA